jgi:hypothetical protein
MIKHAPIRVRIEEHHFSDLPDNIHNWTYSVHSKVEELLQLEALVLLVLTLSHYIDINLMHGIAMGRLVTGIEHLVNKLPIEWHFKKQATVEISTYGSEFAAAS